LPLRTLLLFCLLAAGVARAAAPASLLDEAHAKALARNPYWRALLHYAGGVSEIRSPEFFLSPAGRRDAEAELEATLEAFFAPPGTSPDRHAQCRFVARYRWLRRNLDWSRAYPPKVTCAQYRAYAAAGAVESVSVIYATGYLSNPASFYGHILVKFNTRRGTFANELLEQSLNFGAAVPRGENPVLYVAKGLFGGYDAAFTNARFFTVNHAYAENDLRDLWEYVLDLRPEEVDALLAHSWEILGENFDYYFLKENCAFRMAQFLGLVIHRPLLPELPWAMPASLFDRLSAIERDGKPLVREVRRIPSRQSVFRGRYAALSDIQRSSADALVAHGLDFGDSGYRDLSVEEKIGVVDMLLDYYEYRIVSDRKDPTLGQAKQKLLVERIRLPPREASDVAVSAAAPPHEGPLPFLLGAGVLHNTVQGNGLLLRLRPASYDPLSLDAGRIANSTLAVFDLTAVAFNDSLRVRRFDLINVATLNSAATSLPHDGGMAWSFRAGYEAHDLECQSCGVAKIAGGVGAAHAVTPRATGFAMVDVELRTRYADFGWLAATPRLGLIGMPMPGWKTSLSIGRRAYLVGEAPSERVLKWENRLGSQRNWDLRLSYEQHSARELTAALSWYW
jgi:hypothetical protein